MARPGQTGKRTQIDEKWSVLREQWGQRGIGLSLRSGRSSNGTTGTYDPNKKKITLYKDEIARHARQTGQDPIKIARSTLTHEMAHAQREKNPSKPGKYYPHDRPFNRIAEGMGEGERKPRKSRRGEGFVNTRRG